MPDTHAYIAAGTARQPQRYVIADADRQATAWVSTPEPVPVRR